MRERERGLCYLVLFHPSINSVDQHLIFACNAQDMFNFGVFPPVGRYFKSLRVGTLWFSRHVSIRPHIGSPGADNVLVLASLAARPIDVKGRPRGDEHDGLEFVSLAKGKVGKFAARVHRMGQDGQTQVASGRVTPKNDLGGGPLQFGPHIVDGFNGLDDLGGVRRVRNQGVLEKEESHMVSALLESLLDTVPEFQVSVVAIE